MGIRQYNNRAVTCLGYVGQLFPVTETMIQHEKTLVQRVMHMINNALPPGMHFNLQSLGLPSVHSIVVMNRAARIRTAKVTAKGWKVQKQKLDKAIIEHSYRTSHEG